MTLGTLQDILKDKKFRLVIAILIFIAILGISSFLATQPTKTPLGTGIEPEIRPIKPSVRVLRVEPLPDSNDVSSSPTIAITFKESIIKKDVQITSSPKVSFKSSLSSGGYVLKLTPKSPLTSAKKYTLGVVYEKVKIFSWSFTTGKKQVDTNVLEKIKGKLPHDGNHFRITYTKASDKFYVVIDAKPVVTYKQSALNWFADQGLPDAESKINIFYYPVGDAIDPNF